MKDRGFCIGGDYIWKVLSFCVKMLNVMSKTQTMSDLLKKVDNLRLSFNQGDVIEGEVVAIKDKYALLDIGAKSEGILPSYELKGQPLELKQKLWVYVVTPEDKEGQILLSLQKAQVFKAWEELAKAEEKETNLEAQITGHNKGGITANILGLSGFVPFSHLINPPDPEWERPQFQSYVDKMRGTTIKVKVLELSEAENRIILSERGALEEKLLIQKQEALGKIKLGDVLEAEILSVLPYGLKVSASGTEGLIPSEEVAWEGKAGILNDFSVSQKVKAKVIEVDVENNRLRLSLRQITKDPWDNLADLFKKDQALEAEVSRVTSFGVYVKLQGIEGMLPLSEFGENADIEIGQKLNVLVITIDKAAKRLELKLDAKN